MNHNPTLASVQSDNLFEYDSFPFQIRKNPIAEDYNISNEALGHGINGIVFKCKHLRTGRKCALKKLNNTRRNRQEVILHKKACEKSQYIIQILDVYENVQGSRSYLFIVMEEMEGGELFCRIQQRDVNPYTERDAAKYIKMLVQAVYDLHSMNIAHRDLKPENLLLTDTTNDAILKLGDFGFAKQGNDELKPCSTPLFTPYYVAPEILSRVAYDKACDIWSMGVIMYILLCGFPPFYSNSGQVLSPGMKNRIKAGNYTFEGAEWTLVSENAKSTIRQMLTVDPEQRIKIDEILQCRWLNELTSERPIDISSFQDPEFQQQFSAAVASATNLQRRLDEYSDIPMPILGISRIEKRAAIQKRE